MNIRRTEDRWTRCVLLVGLFLVALLVVSPVAPAVGRHELRAQVAEGWSGDWEGFIEVPRRPVLMRVSLEPADSGWKGSASVMGQVMTLSALGIEGDSVRFDLDLGQLFAFTGRRDADSMEGSVSAPDGTAAFRLRRLPILRPPANRIEAWEQDFDYVQSRFLAYDRSYKPEARAQAEQALAELGDDVSHLTDSEVIVRLSRLAALANNAHTRLYLLRNRTVLRRYPVRFWWFSDGLFVVAAVRQYKEALGCRIVEIEGWDPSAARDSVSRLFSGNESWRDYKTVYLLSSPEVLGGLGLAPDPERLNVSLTCPEGRSRQMVLRPLPLERSDVPTEDWRNLSPRHVRERTDWLPALDLEGTDVPLFLRDPTRHYWFQVVDDPHMLYFQYNRAQNMPGQESLEAFSRRLLGVLDTGGFDALVVDLRFNTGGSIGVAKSLMDELATRSELEAIPLFVLTGPSTFSAGLFHAAQLKASGQATLVGRHPGDELDYWSEGGNILLPNSGLTMHFANGFHSYSGAEPPDGVTVFEDLSLETLEPDLPVEFSSQEYLAGRDPLLAAVIKRLLLP